MNYNIAYALCTEPSTCDTMNTMMNKDVALRFSKVLKRRRHEAGLTQDKLAELAGVSVEHIRRLEGKSPCGVRLEAIVKLSKAIKISPSAFLKGF